MEGEQITVPSVDGASTRRAPSRGASRGGLACRPRLANASSPAAELCCSGPSHKSKLKTPGQEIHRPSSAKQMSKIAEGLAQPPVGPLALEQLGGTPLLTLSEEFHLPK